MKSFSISILLLFVFFILYFSIEKVSFKDRTNYALINELGISYNNMKLYEFTNMSVDDRKVKVKYLVKDAYKKFTELKKKKNILLVTAASFTSAFFNNGTPIGLCAYEGEFLNKMPDQIMDGLVVINSEGLLTVDYISDLDITIKKNDSVSNNSFHLNPRESALDSYFFYNWVEEKKLSVFQTQLVYSYLKSIEENFKSGYFGESNKERRFLVIAEKKGILRNLIIDFKKPDYLMKASKDAFEMLTENDYKVQFMLNLDTGSKNILHVNNGGHLENLNPNLTTKLARIERASNLIVFFTDK